MPCRSSSSGTRTCRSARAARARRGPGRAGKARQTFEVRPDGTIEVSTRRGGNEVVRLFEDEDDLAERSPKLYEKYAELMEIDEDD